MNLEEKKIPPKRFLYLLGMFWTSVICVFILAYGKKLLLDQALCLVTLFSAYWVVTIISIMHQRQIGKFTYNGTTYRNLFMVSLISWILIIVTSYLPDYFGPILLIGFLFVSVCESSLSLASCIFMDLLFCFITGKNSYVLYCYCILSIFGILFAYYLKEQKHEKRIINYFLIGLIQFVIPCIFYDFSYGKLELSAILQFVGLAVIYTVIIYFGFGLLVSMDEKEETVAYETFTDDDFSLLQDLKMFSQGEYLHAKKVSKLAGDCAKEIDANELLCSCAGLYYHIGILDGEPIIDNGISIAQNRCLPYPVVKIISEYGGILNKPTSPESAIVQIVDSLVSKVEAIGDTMESSWNQEMLIYQTFNEFSNAGMYDESGLTMNQFLKIRDCLIIKENLL
ncbi:MAG: hypothetical protein K6F30_01850 [Lachnospiraceae bacterium]|nr:hypothetical protein [Lachnospiraceae bacterium]